MILILLLIYLSSGTPQRQPDLLEEYNLQNLDTQGYIILRKIIPVQIINEIQGLNIAAASFTEIRFWKEDDLEGSIGV